MLRFVRTGATFAPEHGAAKPQRVQRAAFGRPIVLAILRGRSSDAYSCARSAPFRSFAALRLRAIWNTRGRERAIWNTRGHSEWGGA